MRWSVHCCVKCGVSGVFVIAVCKVNRNENQICRVTFSPNVSLVSALRFVLVSWQQEAEGVENFSKELLLHSQTMHTINKMYLKMTTNFLNAWTTADVLNARATEWKPETKQHSVWLTGRVSYLALILLSRLCISLIDIWSPAQLLHKVYLYKDHI